MTQTSAGRQERPVQTLAHKTKGITYYWFITNERQLYSGTCDKETSSRITPVLTNIQSELTV